MERPVDFGAQQEGEATTSQDVDKLIPLQCITFDDEKSTFNSQLVHLLVEEIQDEEVYVISIAGLARSGKSFFLSLLINYLDYLNKNDSTANWENDCEAPIKGFNWATGKRKSVTKGIWMYLYPQPVLGKRLLLLDCQGTRDQEQSTAKLDSMVLFYGLTLSSLQIMNVQRDVEPSDLDTLAACMLSNEQKGEEQTYERLRFLIRDWQDDEEEPEQLQELVTSTQVETVKKCGETILLAFEDVQVVAFPEPGRKVARASQKDNLVLQSVDEDFIGKSKKMFEEICALISQGQRRKLTGREFTDKFMMLATRTVGSFKSPAEMRMAVLVGDAFDKAEKDFLVEIRKAIGTIHKWDTASFHQVCGRIIEKCKNMFFSDERVSSYATDDQRSENISLLYLVGNEMVGSLEFLFEMERWEVKHLKLTKDLAGARKESRELRNKWEKYHAAKSEKKIKQTQEKLRESERKEADINQEIEKGQSERVSLLDDQRKNGAEYPPFSKQWLLQKKMSYHADKMYRELGLARLVVKKAKAWP